MVYEAASQPELWTAFLKGYTETLSADFSVLQIHDMGPHISTVIAAFGLSVPFPLSHDERESLIRGAYSMGVELGRDGECAPTLSSLRTRIPFGEPERKVARFLLPHLSRAWSISQRLGLLAAAESVVDGLPQGVAFFAATGKAVYWNRAADEIFRSNDGLGIRNKELSAADRDCQARLRKTVGAALASSAPPAPETILVSRPSFRRGYQVVVASAGARFSRFVGRPVQVAVALITDPERQLPSSIELLKRVYELTPKESALAVKLLEGKSVERAAEELGITYETTRTHLRRIFAKTGTSRQTELILLLGRLPIWPSRS